MNGIEDMQIRPVAYCSPGRRHEAAQLLALSGEAVLAVVEHPLVPDGRVYLADPSVFDAPGTLTAADWEMPCALGNP